MHRFSFVEEPNRRTKDVVLAITANDTMGIKPGRETGVVGRDMTMQSFMMLRLAPVNQVTDARAEFVYDGDEPVSTLILPFHWSVATDFSSFLISKKQLYDWSDQISGRDVRSRIVRNEPVVEPGMSSYGACYQTISNGRSFEMASLELFLTELTLKASQEGAYCSLSEGIELTLKPHEPSSKILFVVFRSRLQEILKVGASDPFWKQNDIEVAIPEHDPGTSATFSHRLKYPFGFLYF